MKHTLLACAYILAAAVTSSAQTTLYYPHVVNGGADGGVIWKTTILLTNLAPIGTPAVSVSIDFAKDNPDPSAAGTPAVLNFIDEAGAALNSGTMFPMGGGQSKKFTSTGSGGFIGGFATVTSPNGALAGTAIFSEFIGGVLITEAGVPAASAVTRQAVFVDTQNGYNIGVAYANPGPNKATVSLQLLNASAVVVSMTTRSLGSFNHDAKFTSQLFDPPPPELTGTMVIESADPLIAIALRADPSFALYTTLQTVNLASLFLPALQWIEHGPWMSPFTSIARLLSNLPLFMG